MHHVGVAVRSLADAVPAYERLFGYRVLAGPVDDPVQRVSVCFLGVAPGDAPAIELVAPGDGASPIRTALAKGVGAYHACYEVDDLERALLEARAAGCVVVAEPVPAAAFAGRRIAWIYMPSRQLVELLETEKEPDDGGDERAA
jgi:methylmalonyl-CoA/ethylmalonyl-CoA epimerase